MEALPLAVLIVDIDSIVARSLFSVAETSSPFWVSLEVIVRLCDYQTLPISVDFLLRTYGRKHRWRKMPRETHD